MLAKIVNTNIKLLSQSPLFPSIFLKLTDSHIFILHLEEWAVILSLSPSVHILDHVLYHVSLLWYFCLVRSSHCDHILWLARDHTFN